MTTTSPAARPYRASTSPESGHGHLSRAQRRCRPVSQDTHTSRCPARAAVRQPMAGRYRRPLAAAVCRRASRLPSARHRRGRRVGRGAEPNGHAERVVGRGGPCRDHRSRRLVFRHRLLPRHARPQAPGRDKRASAHRGRGPQRILRREGTRHRFHTVQTSQPVTQHDHEGEQSTSNRPFPLIPVPVCLGGSHHDDT